MKGKTHPYLDLAAVPAVGEALLGARPAFVLSSDGTSLLWANAAGAVFFGERHIGDLLRRRFSDLNPIKAQAARLARLLPTETPRLEILRIGQGVSLATLPAACLRLNLDDDVRAILAIAAAGATIESITARAERLVDVIGASDCLAAVLTGEGRVLAASGGYDELASAEPAIDTLVAAAQGSGDRLIKRSLAIGGSERQAGAVRFRSDGRDCFLVIVGPVEERSASAARPEAADAAPPHAAVEAPPSVDDDQPSLALEMPIEMMFPDIDEADDERPTVRFVFETDRDARFTFVSPELAAIVGERNAAIVGHRFEEVSNVLDLDPNAEVTPAFEAGEGFSALVYWPAGGGECIAVDLTMIPVRGRDRKLTGFRGFGTCWPNERQPDDRAEPVGLEQPMVPIVDEPLAPAMEEPVPPPSGDDLDHAARESIERGMAPRVVPKVFRDEPRTDAESPAMSSNIVRLSGRTPPERLSGTERDAFRRIAEALATRNEAAAGETGESEKPAHKEHHKQPVAEIDARLLDRLPIGVAIFRDRKTLFANRPLLDLLGYDSFETFTAAGGAEAIFPGAEGLAGNIAEAGGSLAARRRDGSAVPVKVWLHAVTFAGATALMLSLSAGHERSGDSEDELVVTQAKAEARSEELEAILNTATDGVIVIDGRGKIGSMNRAAEALFGVESSEYRGRYFTDLLADESQKAALDYLDGLASNGVASVLNDGREVIGRVPQGGLIPLFMTMGRIGTADKFCAVLSDITHWKNVEGELIAAKRAAEAANAQKSDFLAKISHEIRTPLNAIIGFSELMIEQRFGPIGNDRYRDYLRDIHVSGAHLMSLINDLLDLSKIEAGKVDLSFEAVPVNASIQESVALMQPQANRERIIIRTSLSADVPNVVADARSFRQILLNLMSNAIKFTRAGGQVIVSSTLEENGEVVVRIRDTGIGMSDKDIETALKPFRQVAILAGDREHGTGLGLPLTKALVEANRATFAIDSAPNQGTLVRITFPTTRVLAG